MDIIYNILDWYHSEKLGGQTRSVKWRSVRNSYIADNPKCECCNRKNKILQPLEVHHKKPFHLNPELELDINNLITLCRHCHLLVGHLMDYTGYNETVKEDAKNFRQRIIYK